MDRSSIWSDVGTVYHCILSIKGFRHATIEKINCFTNPLLYYKFTYEIVNLSINFRSLKVVHNSGVERFLS